MVNIVKIAVFSIVYATSVLAEGPEYHASNGQIFTGKPNANGIVLTSKHPVSIYKEDGANSQWEEAPEIIYVGKSCDVLSTAKGAGTWSWANGGFVIEFNGLTLGFPRQELDAGQGSNCRM